MKNLLGTFTATVIVLLVCAPLFGQSGYMTTPTMAPADNTAWCATKNCLLSIGSDDAKTGYSGIAAGVDGTVYAYRASTNEIYTWTTAAGWVEHTALYQPGGVTKIAQLSVGSAANVLVLNGTAHSTGNAYILNAAGNGWTSLKKWLEPGTAGIGADGSVWGIDTNGNAVAYIAGAWATMGTGVSMNLAVSSSISTGHVWGVDSSSVLRQWNGTSFAALSPAPPFTPATYSGAVAAVGETGLAVIDSTGGIHVSSDGGNTWSTIAGTATTITGGGVFTFVESAAGIFHLNLMVPSLTTTFAGIFVCDWPQSGFPCEDYGLEVTIYATSSFGGPLGGAHGINGVTTYMTGGIPQYLETQATETGANCDLIVNPSDTNCYAMPGGPWGDELATCVEDYFFPVPPPPFQAEAAFTRAYWNGVPAPACDQSGKCTYLTHNNCTATTTPPDLNISSIISGNFVGDSYVSWLSLGLCIRAGYSGPWTCSPALSWLESINVRLAPYACTHNP